MSKITLFNKEETLKILENIEHNKKIMLLFEGNSQKQKQLLIENIHFYNDLRRFKNKPIQTTKKVLKHSIPPNIEFCNTFEDNKRDDFIKDSFNNYLYQFHK